MQMRVTTGPTGADPQTGRKRRARRLHRPMFALAALMFVAACLGPSQDDIRAQLERWFVVGEPDYFRSTARCAAAAFPLLQDTPKAALRQESDVPRALARLEREGVMALGLEGVTPDQTFIEVMNSKRAVGVYVQAAAFAGRSCMDKVTEGAFRAALTNPRAVFVWDRAMGALILMDPDQAQVFWASGDG